MLTELVDVRQRKRTVNCQIDKNTLPWGVRYRASARNWVPGTGLKLTGSDGAKPNDS